METRAYDLQGRLTAWTTGTVDARSYSYDANGNITAINGDAFGYDWLDRITAAPALGFTWDGNGNRLTDVTGSYSYTTSSNRMDGNPAGTVSLDAAGNTLATNGLDLVYGQAGRLASASSGGNLLGQYAYSFDGHRAVKTVQGSTTLFHYGVDGNLLAETDAAGATLKEYVWDDDGRPLAQIEAGAITFLHADHLGTPRFGTDAGKAVVWQWYERPFGTGPPSGTVTVNLRHPGQYADSETGFFQNWHRTYDPASGRYLESDPIGLAAGVNTFGYADANPLGRSDLRGLDWSDSVNHWWQSSVAGFQSDTPMEMVSRALQGLPVEGAFVAGVGAIKRISSVEQCVTKGVINPNVVRFSQDSVKGVFRNGTTLNGAADALRAGGMEAGVRFPPIRLVERDGLLFTLDNRRLIVFSLAGQPVPYRMATEAEIAKEFTSKFSTTSAQGWGRFITVRP